MNPLLKKEILDQLDRLASEQQKQVLDFARSLTTPLPPGKPGKELLPFAGAIDADDLRTMMQAIEEGCEKVNLSEWFRDPGIKVSEPGALPPSD
ncbi:MAG: hypothetical protein HYY65_05225 [Candidatus Tectomicrobia bacterium]|uniref:DUF2281 domain-containing protein n=1 Tax=Tectimicrobiota bacterium TaxID=2528274 RepID=A0A932GNK9_UNCTE|nr:hypothetical protein [Candidatus Tectomicrobia bacterium]